MMMAIRQCEDTECQSTVHLRMVTMVNCYLYFTTIKKIQKKDD